MKKTQMKKTQTMAIAAALVTAALIAPTRSDATAEARSEPDLSTPSTGEMKTEVAVQTPAERAIEQAERWIDRKPDQPRSHAALAMAFARRARETAEMDYYERGHEALARAFELDPESLEAARAKAWLLLGQHRFAEGLKVAEAVQKRVPDDLLTYAMIADAAVELGDYTKAEETVQWMLDLRPGSVPALTRGAYLRELFGNIPGAIDWMGAAYRRVRATETEDRAWILTHMAHLERLQGNLAPAGRWAEQALEIFPGYHYALAQLAKVRETEGKLEEAVRLWTEHYEVAPHPENLFYLAKAKYRLGDREEALRMMGEFESLALEESENEDNANRDLVLYYVDYANQPAEALALAKRETERRQDVLTLDAYAWALFSAGQVEAARDVIDEVMAVGVVDPELLAHAEIIRESTGLPSR